MLNIDKMKSQVSNYQISFDKYDKEVFIIKGSGNKQNWVKVSVERAIAWVNVGIDDIDGRNKDEMLKLLNSWN